MSEQNVPRTTRYVPIFILLPFGATHVAHDRADAPAVNVPAVNVPAPVREAAHAVAEYETRDGRFIVLRVATPDGATPREPRDSASAARVPRITVVLPTADRD